MVEFVRKPVTSAPPTASQLFWRMALPDRHELPFVLLLIVITFLGFLFRLVHMLQPVGFDEAYTYLAYANQPYKQILTDYSFPNNHIFHTLLVAVTTHLIPVQSVWVMRLPALIAGILMIPAVYLAGRALYHPQVGLVGATLVASSTLLINFSVDARGYSLLCLMSLVMLWMAGSLTKRSHWSGWMVLTIAGVLGAFTIPIMLYPLAAIYVWMVVDATLSSEADKSIKRPILPIFISAFGVVIGTFLVYSPVIFWGTGLESITANGFVSPLGWDEFILDIQSRLNNTWRGWTETETPLVYWGLIIGFGFSLLFHHRLTKSRVHLVLTSVVVLGTMLSIQQVAPMPRIWQILLPWFYLWVGAGFVGLISLLPEKANKWIGTIFVILVAGFILLTRSTQIMRDIYPERATPGVEELIAWILQDQIKENEQIVTVLPSGTQVKYYYNQTGDIVADFYITSRPADPLTASYLVVVNKKYDETLDHVITKNHLQDKVDIKLVMQVANYKQVDFYRIPTLTQP